MPTSDIRHRLEKHARQLPVLPQALVQLMALDEASEDYFDELLGVVEIEPSFAMRILSMANSAVIGTQEPVTTLRSALVCIGSRGAADLVLALSVARVFVPRDDWEKSLWRHSIHVAVASRTLAREIDDAELPAEAAYACGLLHDVGRFILFQEGPELLRRIDESGWESGEELIELERSICGLSHSELGALACERWSLPELVCECVLHHHAVPDWSATDPVSRLTAVVRGADLAMFATAIPGSEGLECSSDEDLEAFARREWPEPLPRKAPALRSILCRANGEADAAVGALGLE